MRDYNTAGQGFAAEYTTARREAARYGDTARDLIETPPDLDAAHVDTLIYWTARLAARAARHSALVARLWTKEDSTP